LGENNVVHDALITLIDSSESLDDRCAAAALLGTFKYDQAKVDGPSTTKSLFKLTSDLSADELKRAQDFEKRQAGGFTETTNFVPNDPGSRDDGYPRRHVVARIINVGKGLKAVKPALPEEAQKQVDAILAAFLPAVKAATDERTGPLGVANAIRSMNEAIVAVIGEPEGDDDDADDEEFSVGGPPAAAAATPPAALPTTAPEDAEPGPETPAPAATPAEDPSAATAPAADAPPTPTPPATEPAPAQPEAAKN
jgi:hypothetical protein